MASQIDWTQYLAEDDAEAPLHVLGYTCTQRISWYLNKEVQLRPGMRHLPNFGGLGELIGLDGLAITEMSRRDNPGMGILDLWKDRGDLNPTVGNLVKYLARLGRQDILTDTADWIKEEIQTHKDRQKNLVVQCDSVTSDSCMEETDRILTIDDVMEGMAIYDAFVCYDGADVDFVKAMIAKLEDPREFGFRFFVPGRNNLVGTNSHALTTKIISERCRHMIVVLSPSFLQSPACEFQAAYAFALSPGARDKKIVPIKIEECRTPDILQIMACCDFTNRNLLDWCWKRLAMSIMCPMPNSDFVGPKRFVPPLGSALAAWARLGMSEMGGGGSGRSSPSSSSSMSRWDSGFSSSSTNLRRGPNTAPVSSNPRTPHSSGSSSSDVGAAAVAPQSLTAPVSSTPSSRQQQQSSKNSSSVIQKITQTLHKRKKQKTIARTPEEQEDPAPM